MNDWSAPSQVTGLIDALRQRDRDPKYVSAPILDVYGRISVNPETGETEKVDRQIEDNLNEVRRRHARLGEVLRDDGRSAWNPRAKRPGWEQLVCRMESGASAGVVAWHTDRLMRQPRDLERLISFGDRGLIVASCHGDYSLASADDRFALRVITAAAAKSSDDTSRRQKRKAAAMRAAGRQSAGPRWFGLPGSYRGVTATPELLAAEREAIAWGARAHLDGASLMDVAKEWNRRELRTIQGNLWQPRTVGDTLSHPRLAGLLAYQGNIVGRIAGVEPIITAEEHGALVARFAARKRGRPATEGYLLSGGLLICGRCGNTMSGRPSAHRPLADGTPTKTYMCRIRKIGAGHCGNLTMELRKTEAEVRSMVIRILSDPKHAQQVARTSAKLAAAQSKVDAAKADAAELGRRLGEGKITLDQYDTIMVPLERRIARLSAEVEALSESGGNQAARAASIEEITAEWDNGDTAARRLMIRRIAPRGIVVQPPPRDGRHANTIPASERLLII